MDILNLNLLIY